MKYQILPLHRGHIPAVALLEQESFSQPWTEGQLEEVLFQDHCSFLVAEGEGGEVLGYASVTVVLDEGNINNIAVAKSVQRQGIGRELLEVFLRFAQEHLAFLTLEVRAGNQAALALYHSAGFVEEGRRAAYYQEPVEDALLLTRRFREVAP